MQQRPNRRSAENVIRLYEEAKQLRSPEENDWRLAAQYCLPRQYSSWTTEGPSTYGQRAAATRRAVYDTTMSRALPKYQAILERMVTPHNMQYQSMKATDDSLMRIRRVREYFEALTRLIFTYRYGPKAGFSRGATHIYQQLGVYGTGPLYLGQRKPNALYNKKSLLYKPVNLRDFFILVNDDGEMVGAFRRFFLNFRQFKEKFPNSPVPTCFAGKTAETYNEGEYKEFIHFTIARDGDFDPFALDMRRHPVEAGYISVADKQYVGDEAGYRSMPYVAPTTVVKEADSPYGFSPAVQALAAAGTASSVKKTTLKQGQKAADPVILTHDDGVMNGGVDLRPGAINPGGLDSQGRKLISTLDTGNFNVSDALLQDERADINDSFFVTLFQILQETPEMTAAEVYERVAEKVSMLSPTMNALQDEFISPVTMREIDIFIEMGLVADGDGKPGLQMPPELIEAEGEYEVIFTSPMAKNQYAEEVSGFFRAFEVALNAAQQTQDPSHIDHFNLDVAIPEVSAQMSTPARWMNDEAKVRKIREQRQQQQQQSELLKNAAPLASAAKTLTQTEGQ